MNIFHIYSGSFAQNLLFLLLGIIAIEIGKMEGMLFLISTYSVPKTCPVLGAEE